MANILLAFSLVLAAVSAQSILPSVPDSTFPACALSCQPLLTAQTACVPPAQPVTDQYVYDQCYCQQPTIDGLLNSPDGVCDSTCTVESDRVLLMQWYQNFCNQVDKTLLPSEPGASSTSTSDSTASTSSDTTSSGTTSSDTTLSDTTSSEITFTSTIVTAAPTTAPSTFVTNPITPTVIIVTITSTNTPSATASSQAANGAASSSSNKPWIDNHWQWILMIAILIIGLSLLAWLAIWYKKRHNRKNDEKRAAANNVPVMREKRGENPPVNRISSATLEEMFGPHQHQDLTQGWDYTSEQRRELGIGGMAAAMRKKSRERKQSREQAQRDASQKGKGRETASRVREFKAASRTRSRSERRADTQREFDRETLAARTRSLRTADEQAFGRIDDRIERG